MNLHEDKPAFITLIGNINQRSGIREDVLEKDYYVTLILKELAQKQCDGLPAYFKGGTALYKALHSIRRFSEDIDITVDAGSTRTQTDKNLDKSTKEYKSIERERSGADRNERSMRTIHYKYAPELPYDENDALQRFGRIKVECISFAINEPVEELAIAPALYDKATHEERVILEERYDISPFVIKTSSLERIFIDKLFAAESYFRKMDSVERAFDCAKHIYDLCVLWDNPKIQDFMKKPEEVKRIVGIRLEEEKVRLDGIAGVQLNEFNFFQSPFEKSMLKEQFARMQSIYVFNPEDMISIKRATTILRNMAAELRIPMRGMEIER